MDLNEYLEFLPEGVENIPPGSDKDLSWAAFDEARNARWAHLFEADLCEREEDKEFVQLSEDPYIKHFNVPPSEQRRRRYAIEFVLDNMARAIYTETGDSALDVIRETTNKTDIAAFTKTALPLVRKYLSQQFLWEIVPTYPMSQATIRLFSADTTYGTGGVYSSGTSIYGSPDPAYAEDPGECEEPSELDFSLSGDTVTAISKKLKGLWNIEAAQDAASYHQLVLENEVVRMLGIKINHEINRYGINQLVANVATTTNWNSTQPMAATNGWSNATPRQYQESLWDTIEDANRAIKDAQYVNANYLLCGTQFASRLRKLNGFRLAHSNDAATTEVITGPNLFGTLNGRYRVYEDPEFADDKCLIGHKGTWIDKTAAVYLPYVPAWRTPVIHNTTLCPGVGYLTRFGFKVINGNFLGMIVVS